MTSEGAILAVPTYGAVSTAKAALEAHIRQLALELMPLGITVNGIRAGVTDTPALRRIPQWELLVKAAEPRNPGGRMTRPEDVADALVVLATPNTRWMTGNIIGVDGGEVMGSRRGGPMTTAEAPCTHLTAVAGDPPAARTNGCESVPRHRPGVGAAAPVPGVRPGGLLRQLHRQARDRALPRDRPRDHPDAPARRHLALVLRRRGGFRLLTGDPDRCSVGCAGR